jgi:hypothetical protein
MRAAYPDKSAREKGERRGARERESERNTHTVLGRGSGMARGGAGGGEDHSGRARRDKGEEDGGDGNVCKGPARADGSGAITSREEMSKSMGDNVDVIVCGNADDDEDVEDIVAVSVSVAVAVAVAGAAAVGAAAAVVVVVVVVVGVAAVAAVGAVAEDDDDDDGNDGDAVAASIGAKLDFCAAKSVNGRGARTSSTSTLSVARGSASTCVAEIGRMPM